MFHGSAVAAAASASASASATAGIRAWSPGIHESSPVEYYYRSISCTKKIDEQAQVNAALPRLFVCGGVVVRQLFFGCYFDATSSAVSTVPFQFHSLEMEGGKKKKKKKLGLPFCGPAILRCACAGP